MSALFATALAMPAAAQVTSRVSVTSGGLQGNNHSLVSKFSSDARYVVFESLATDLVPGDTNGVSDIFLHDRFAGTTERVSLDSGEAQVNGESHYPSVSEDGRYVAFWSTASDLVTGDTNGSPDVFVRDRVAGSTERMSVDSSGVEGNGPSYECLISGDGRYVAFHGDANNLVSGDTNVAWDIFVHDRQSGTTERVSVDSSGVQGNSRSYFPSMSFDGRYVAFDSEASNLVTGDTNATFDVFVRDRLANTTERVSVDSGAVQANGDSSFAWISADGRYVGFTSGATNLVGGDTNGKYDGFVRDRQNNVTERVSVGSGGGQGNGDSGVTSISVDGRYVTFDSSAANFFSEDGNGSIEDVFVRDRLTGTTEFASVDTFGSQGGGFSGGGSISANGRYVVFTSVTSLVVRDTNGFADIFVRDRSASGFTGLCDPGEDGVIGCPCSNPPSGNGRGCNNFGAGPVDSGTLSGTGIASLQADTVLLTATGENNTSLTVFWTGKDPLSPTGVAHGAGVRCVTQDLRRMYTHSASGGTVSAPVGADLSVSARTAQLYGTAISAGETRHYFAIYRDPNAWVACGNTSSTINLTNAGSIAWNP